MNDSVEADITNDFDESDNIFDFTTHSSEEENNAI